jgi:hypothetical protein
MAMVLVEGGDQLPALVGQYNKTVDSRGAATSINGCLRSTVAAAVVVGVMAVWF